MKVRIVVFMFLCVAIASCFAAYAAGLPGPIGEPVQADFSFTGDDDTTPAPVPDRSSLVERELSGTSMSFGFTDGDSDDESTDDGEAVPPSASGESIIQREMSQESQSFGFTD